MITRIAGHVLVHSKNAGFPGRSASKIAVPAVCIPPFLLFLLMVVRNFFFFSLGGARARASLLSSVLSIRRSRRLLVY